ncbi:PucR family transcriptional regulator [Amycolatopsis sp. H20-H5]|uniref:PucR family transcriptional regulator n=1 Tax=Amycolatopsis sp. H20-H5 TaxID=3046309 RepID=UPI002DBD23B4|nr:helix-turn-helix domain-containing protein [Amycolatopsis sp. H20-H5]MEC3980084.1 helix-turn-helix domain-containing protein [Amycolatopsis sp. H20-H5]
MTDVTAASALLPDLLKSAANKDSELRTSTANSSLPDSLSSGFTPESPGRRAGPVERRDLGSLLPARMAHWLGEHGDALAAAILEEIQNSVPQFRLDTTTNHGIRRAVGHCVERALAAAKPDENWNVLFRTFGRIEFEEGRSLDFLHTAYGIGGRAAWRHISAGGRALGLTTDVLCRCADAIFAYVEEISALSIEGYAVAQHHSAAALSLHRRRLLELLVADTPATGRIVAAHATSAQWHLPLDVAVVVLEPRTTHPGIGIPDLPGEILADWDGGQPWLITANPARDMRDLAGKLGQWRVAVGPTVPLANAASSLARARQTMRLLKRGVIADAAVVWCADHLSTLCLLADEVLLEELCARALAPLAGLTPKRRARLCETLLTWLQSRGSAPEIAAKLKVHPQTVRYRLHQLTDLFGERLDNADARLDMEIALRAEHLLATAAP